MIKLVALVRRVAWLTPADFHQQLAKRRLEPEPSGVRGYVQNHVLLSGYRSREPVVDAVVEVWFDDPATAGQCDLRSAGRPLAADICDPSAVVAVTTQEHLVKPGSPVEGGVKNIEIVHRRRDLPVEEFHRYWREHHGPLAATIGPILRYVQSHAVDDAATRPFDGIATTWFESTSAMRESALTPEYAATRADEEHFLVEPLPFVITTEHVLVEPPRLGAPPASG